MEIKMKLTKTIKTKDKENKIEIKITQSGDAKWDSKDFKRDFEYLLDSIMITLIKNGCHVSDTESK
jgi:hypothetical protein